MKTGSESKWPSFAMRGASLGRLALLAFLILLVKVGAHALPRILERPLPSDVSRYDHHMGDGATEMGVLAAHQFWKQNGYGRSVLIPCLASTAEGDCVPYTHYPPGPYLATSFALKAGEWLASEEAAIKAARILVFALTCFISAAAIALLSFHSGAGWGMAILLSWMLAKCRGFLIFSDNFFGHGYVFAWQGLALATLIFPSRLQRQPWVYGLLAGAASYFSVELIPFFVFAPILVFLTSAGSFRENGILCRKLVFWALASLAIVMGARILQNALLMGGLSAVVADWVAIIRFRVLGDTASVQVDKSTFQLSPAQYFGALHYYRTMMLPSHSSKVFVAVAAFLLGRRSFRRFGILALSGVLCLSWSFTFLQHSYIHSFTSRYVMWVFLVAIFLFALEFMELLEGLWRRYAERKARALVIE